MTKALLLLIVLTGAVPAQQPAAQPVAQLSAVTYTAAVGQTFGNLVQVTNGLRDGDRVVVRGTDKMPRQ